MPHVIKRNESTVTLSPRVETVALFIGKVFAVGAGLAILVVIFT